MIWLLWVVLIPAGILVALLILAALLVLGAALIAVACFSSGGGPEPR